MVVCGRAETARPPPGHTAFSWSHSLSGDLPPPGHTHYSWFITVAGDEIEKLAGSSHDEALKTAVPAVDTIGAGFAVWTEQNCAPDVFPKYLPPMVQTSGGGGLSALVRHMQRLESLSTNLTEATLTEASEDSQVFFRDAFFTIIYDAYPKARVHLLVIPTQGWQKIAGPHVLRPAEHGDLLAGLSNITKWLQNGFLPLLGGVHELQCGVHAIPSLQPLHVHAISDDCRSGPFTASMKKKMHWNSMNTAFFVRMENLAQAVFQEGGFFVNTAAMKALKSQPLPDGLRLQ